MDKKKSLQDIYESIEEQLEYLDTKPYSNTIISLNLRIAARDYGYQAVNKLIDELNLTHYGWEKKCHT